MSDNLRSEQWKELGNKRLSNLEPRVSSEKMSENLMSGIISWSLATAGIKDSLMLLHRSFLSSAIALVDGKEKIVSYQKWEHIYFHIFQR
jgi:hypothetical protein